MRILSIDSSDVFCRVGISDEASHVAYSRRLPYGQAENLLPMIEESLSASAIGKDDLQAIAVSVGPGSFSGIRIGLATARGLGLALNKPVLGYGNFALWHETLSAIYTLPPQAVLLIILQSKRRDLYAAAYGGGRGNRYRLSPQTAEPQALQEFIVAQNSTTKLYLGGNMNEEFLSLLSSRAAERLEILPCHDFALWHLSRLATEDMKRRHYPMAEPLYLRKAQTSVAKKIWRKAHAGG